MKSNLPVHFLFCAAAMTISSCTAMSEKLPASTAKAATTVMEGHKGGTEYDKPGYVTFLEDGRLWVFEEGSEDLAKFKTQGEPAKMVVLPAAGPDGMTLKGTERDVMMEYALTIPGYKVMMDEGRLWVFEEGSEDLARFMEHGEPAKMVVLPAAGPRGLTLKGTERDVMMEYALTKPGYKVMMDEGRLWVFEEGSEDLAKFMEHGEPAKMVVLPAAGPRGITLKGTDRDVMMEYALTKPGFTVMMDEGRLWVFRSGSEELAHFMEHGEPAKMVVRPGAGPRGVTLKSVDTTILDAYQAL